MVGHDAAVEAGDRTAWAGQPTSFNFNAMTNGVAAPTWARAAGYSLEQVDAFLGQLGNPIGIASYKPHHSTRGGFSAQLSRHDRHSD